MSESQQTRRRLIVNADDFGFSDGVNRAVFAASDTGIVTSASLLVRRDGASDAADGSQERPGLSVGLHLDLGEWEYRDGDWAPLYEVVPLEDQHVVAEEAGRQLGMFRALTGRNPTHLNSHQHIHAREPVRSVARRLASELGIPLRHETPAIQYCGRFYGQTAEGAPLPGAITVDALLTILAELPTGVTELVCHPGEGDDSGTMYRAERALETEVLCDPRVRATLIGQGIELCSFLDIRKMLDERDGDFDRRE